MRRTRRATGRTPACTRAVSTSGHSPDTPGRVSPGDTPDAVPSFRRGPWVQSPQWPSRSPCWRSDCATRGRSGPASGGARTMARIDSQAEAWTTTLRAEQAALDIGAELGPADPTAYTMRRPIPEPMPMARPGTDHRDGEPEGRGRQNHHHDQPGCGPGRVRPADAPGRLRPAGSAVGRARR